MDFSINNFFNSTECQEFLEFMEKNGEVFSYNKNESWDCKRVYDNDFKRMIIEKINLLYSQKKIEFWFDYSSFNLTGINLSITKYYQGRYLDLHLDKSSSYTTVIPLTENYQDGRFVISETPGDIKEESNQKINLKMGQGITFRGDKTYHGVMPVTNGIRCAMNIWMNDKNFEYYKVDLSKKII